MSSGNAVIHQESVIAYCPCQRRRVGNTIHVYGRRSPFNHPRDGCFPFACVIGPDYLCNLAAWLLLFGISVAFLAIVAWRLHPFVAVANGITLFAVSAALLVTTLSDPGYLPKLTPHESAAIKAAAAEEGARSLLVVGAAAAAAAAAETLNVVTAAAAAAAVGPTFVANTDDTMSGGSGSGDMEGVNFALSGFTTCSVCLVPRERGTAHCYDCSRCVLALDHHCPWSSKCIGKGNIRPFGIFLTLLGVHSLFTVVGFIAWLVAIRGTPT
jgi:hypothetical protein